MDSTMRGLRRQAGRAAHVMGSSHNLDVHRLPEGEFRGTWMSRTRDKAPVFTSPNDPLHTIEDYSGPVFFTS